MKIVLRNYRHTSTTLMSFIRIPPKVTVLALLFGIIAFFILLSTITFLIERLESVFLDTIAGEL